MRKMFIFAMAVSAILSANKVLAVEDLDTVELDTSDGSLVLYGDVNEKEIYSYSNYAESIESAGANVDIITRKDIEKQGNADLSELLDQVGSVQVQNANGSAGSPSSVRMRGTDRVRMTIDGVRADRTSLTSPTVEPQFILSDDLERIEIIKGPQGNVSGTNASGGLIAMQTRRGKGPFSIEMGSEMGNLGQFKERFALMGGNHSIDYYMGVTWFKTDGGMRTNNLGKINNDDYNNLNVVANIGKRLLDERAEIRNVFRFSRARKDIGIGYYQTQMGQYQSPNNYGLNYDFMDVISFTHNPNDKYNYDTKFSIYHNESDSYILPDMISGDPTYESISKINSTRLNAQTQHNYKITDWNTISAGYNLETEFIDGNSRDVGAFSGTVLNGYSGNTIQNDVFVNDSINIKDKLFLRGGARLSHNSDFGTYVTPNASAALVLPTFKLEGAKTKFRGSWGQSVNNPTLYQRFGTLRTPFMQSLANPNLKAEKMQSWDVGVTQSFFEDKLSFDLGYFNSDYKDYLGYIGTTDPNTWIYTGQYVNVDRARIQGFESKITWEPTNWLKAVASYTYTDSEDKTTHADLPACPRNSIKGTVYWTPNEIFNLFAGVEANSGRYMSSARNADKTDSYVDVKLGGKVRLIKTENAELSLRGTVYNLLDQDISMYRTGPTMYYAPGINFRAGLFMKYTFPERNQIENI